MDQQPPPSREYASRLFFIILLFVFMNGNGNQPGGPGFPTVRDYAADRVAKSRHSLGILNATRWQDFAPRDQKTPGYDPGRYLNITGFRKEDGYKWEYLDPFRERCEVFSEEARKRLGTGEDKNRGLGLIGEVYENVTGIVVGSWTRFHNIEPGNATETSGLNLTEISPDTDWSFRDEKFWTRNITGQEGKMVLKVDEKDADEMVLSEKVKADRVLQESGEADGKDDKWNTDLIRDVSATLTIQDETSSGDGWEMRLHGIHWPRTGVLLMTTTSDKFAGIFGLPHLTMNTGYFASSQKLLNMTLEKTVERMEHAVWLDPSNPWTSSPESQGDAMSPVPHCEFVVFAQVYPVKIDRTTGGAYLREQDVVKAIEQELRYPNGAPIPAIPQLQMSTVMFSPDCGFILESKGPPGFSPKEGEHLVGKKQESWLHDIEHWLLMFALVMFGQILLLKVQSKEASTPSTIGRVSLYTVTMMLLGDAFLFSILSFLTTLAPNLFPSSLLSAFSALLSVALSLKFVGAVYNVQEPESRERLRLRQAAEAASRPPQSTVTPQVAAAQAIVGAQGHDPTTATTAPINPTITPDPPIIIPSDQELDIEIADRMAAAQARLARPLLPTTNTPAAPIQPPSSSTFTALYIRSVIGLTFLLFLSASASSWSTPFRSAYVHIISIFYLSFWLPQIRRNIVRNCRKALLWKFVVGQSVLRLLPFAYFYVKEDNVLFSETDWKAFWVYAGWVWIQIWILISQEILGPRWCVPKGWTEEGWDYHPILLEDNAEAGGLPIGLVQIPAGSPTLSRSDTWSSEDRKRKDGTFRSVDCAICMQVLEVPVVAAGEDAGSANSVTGLLNRRLYMVTPCRHVFHSQCLEGWMRFRLQCPICRENLPAL
ncbi:hypothetical protein HYALB_00006473 [Hymenoscyphus albidus]|uniref:DSC E3 ubiquitin ligase complex subunit A n=1 Tax=Hymenoscyphus albidus TaxID=595503 RepID=A0A9N9LJ21_9HELO|nr:hypothetical protein HYALB_00006473 [Hymenoscyphus albidus]